MQVSVLDLDSGICRSFCPRISEGCMQLACWLGLISSQGSTEFGTSAPKMGCVQGSFKKGLVIGSCQVERPRFCHFYLFESSQCGCWLLLEQAQIETCRCLWQAPYCPHSCHIVFVKSESPSPPLPRHEEWSSLLAYWPPATCGHALEPPHVIS